MAYVHETRTKKRILQKKTNQENLAAAINILENIEANYFYKVCRNSKNMIHGLVVLLNGQDQKMSLSVRAATAISMIDSMSQDGRLASHIRTMLWQVVSNLEGIRE
ncbi:MAG: UPF0147 family protein [Candidatus Nitrosopolaris sp.]